MVMVLGGSGTANGITSFSNAAAFADDLTVTGNTTIKKKTVVNYTPATTDNAAIYVAAANCQGGTGYADFLKVQNISHPGVTNPNKTFRLNSTGGIEVINSAYSSNLLTLSDAGYLTVPSQPRVYATKNNGSGWANYYNGGSGTTFINNNAIVNNGSNYNTSTGIFTCPVAGYYYVTSSILMGLGAGANAYYLYKNGSQYGEGVYSNFYSTSVHVECVSSWIVSCSVNDTLKLFVIGANASSVYDLGWSQLTITLLG